jgi:HEAT repeat protein
MPASEQLKDLVARLPDPDRRGMFTENIDKQRIDEAIAAIHAGGPEFVAGLVDMLGPPGSEADVKPRYALHCLTNHVLVVGDEQGRKRLCETLARQLDSGQPKYVKALLCEELRWAGGGEAVAALAKLLDDDELCAPATMALVAIRDGAVDALRAAWPDAKGQPRLHIIHALAELAEPQSAEAFAAALGDETREIRIAAAAGLAGIGAASAAERLLRAADAAQGWERSQLTKSCLVLAERLAESGNSSAAKRIYKQLAESRGDVAESHVRDAARRGMDVLAKT